jgi:hypothetical protein
LEIPDAGTLEIAAGFPAKEFLYLPHKKPLNRISVAFLFRTVFYSLMKRECLAVNGYTY